MNCFECLTKLLSSYQKPSGDWPKIPLTFVVIHHVNPLCPSSSQFKTSLPLASCPRSLFVKMLYIILVFVASKKQYYLLQHMNLKSPNIKKKKKLLTPIWKGIDHKIPQQFSSISSKNMPIFWLLSSLAQLNSAIRLVSTQNGSHSGLHPKWVETSCRAQFS